MRTVPRMRRWSEIASPLPMGGCVRSKTERSPRTREEKALWTRHAPDSVDRLPGLLVVGLFGTRKDDNWVVLNEEHLFNAGYATCEGQPFPTFKPVLRRDPLGSARGIQQRTVAEAEIRVGSVEQFTRGIHANSIAKRQSDFVVASS